MKKIVLLAILIGLFLNSSILFGKVSYGEFQTEIRDTKKINKISIKNSIIGDITLKDSTDGNIRIKYRKGCKPELFSPNVNLETELPKIFVKFSNNKKASDQLEIDIGITTENNNTGLRVDVEIEAPTSVSVKAKVNTGKVNVDHFYGNIDIKNNVGNITVAGKLYNNKIWKLNANLGDVIVYVDKDSSFSLQSNKTIKNSDLFLKDEDEESTNIYNGGKGKLVVSVNLGNINIHLI